MKDFRGKVVAITGAASGIGRATALAFAERGADVALADIDREGLAQVDALVRGKGRRAISDVVDVAREENVGAFCELVYEEFGRTDVLCNNAGVAVGGMFEDTGLNDWRWILGVNVWGVIYGCHYFYPRMIAQGRGGHIVNTASMAALGPLPGTVAYCCTKAAVLAFSEALRIEAARHGIGVSAVCPGIVATNVGRRLRMVSGTRRTDAAGFARKVDALIRRRNYPPEDAAAAVVRAVERNEGVAPVGIEAHAVDLLHRFHRGLHDAVMARALRMILERV
jgi:NAD(P)-dependent dehydrogenase (short-subunit alcohol dehydrogenase family)